MWHSWSKLWRRRETRRAIQRCVGSSFEQLEPRLALTISGPLPSPTDHIHPVLQIYIDGQQVVIPAGVGLTGTTDFNPHTHDLTGTLHIGEGGPAGTGSTVRNVTLQDFFDVWRTTNVGQPTNNPNAIFDTDPSDGTPLPRILDKTVDATHVLRMYVKEASDSAPELEYDSSASSNSLPRPELYVPRDGDQIIIVYESASAAVDGPSFQPIANQTVLAGAPLWLGIDGFDPTGGPLTYTVTVSNPSLLQATLMPTTNRSLRMTVDGYGQMTFQLLDNLVPDVTNHIATLVNRGDFNNSSSLPVKFYRIARNPDGSDFVIQGGPSYPGGVSSLGQFDDVFHPDLQFTSAGLLAMAKSSDDTNDAQIFVTGGPARFLDFQHSIFGVLTDGDEVRQAIQHARASGDGPPPSDILITNTQIIQDRENAVLELKAAEGASGTSSVTLTVTDAQGHSFSRTFQVTVTPDTANSAPFLNPIAPIRGVVNQPITVQLTATDVENNPSFFDAVKPSGETVNYTLNVNNQTGQVTITPPTDFVGTFRVTFGVRGATQTTTADQFDTQTMTVTVAPAAPTLDLASASDSGASNSDNITNSPALDFVVSGLTTGAQVKLLKGTTVLAQGTATGSTLTLTVNNPGTALGQGTSGITATQTVSGIESNASSVLNITYDTSAPVFSSTPPTSALIGFPLTYDAQTNEEGTGGLVYSLTNAPAGATINSTTGVLTWTPTAAQAGTQSFQIVATDAAGNAASQTLNLSVAAADVSFTLSLARSDGSPLTSLANGQDFFLILSTEDVRATARGVFAAYADITWDSSKAVVTGPIQYGPTYNAARSGDTSTAGLIDEAGAISNTTTELGPGVREVLRVPMRATGSGTLTFATDPADSLPLHAVLVYGNNDPVPADKIRFGTASVTIAATFTAVNDSFTVNEDSQNNILNVLANDANIGNNTNTLTIAAVGTPSHGGTVTIVQNGTRLSYTPAANFVGTETFTYTARNQNGEEQTATVTMTVSDVNDPPTAVNDSFSVSRNSTANVLNVLANDSSSPDANETIRVTSVSAGSQGGTITIGANGANILYTPPANFTGTETFTYTISDRATGGLTAQATVTVTVTGLTANNDTFTVVEDSSNNVLDVLANDVLDQQAGGTLTITAVGSTSRGGTVTITQNGTRLSYTPASNFQGTETFTYTISDGQGHSATATATVNVTNVNDPPSAVNDTFTAFKNTTSTFDPLANDTSGPDPTENLVIDSVTQPAHGTVTIVENGKKISYTPTSGYTGPDSFTYTIKDPGGLTSTATVNLTVQDFAPSSLSGFVYFDVNNNGIKDPGELTIAGVTITLTGTPTAGDTTPVNRTVKTGSDGSYRFDNLAPGNYTIRQTQPLFTIDGKVTAGSQGGTAGTNQITINLTQGTTGTGNNFGERGRTPDTISLRDFFASNSRNYAIAALDTSGNQLWYTMQGAIWQGLSNPTISLVNSNSQLRIEAVDSQSQPVVTTLSTTDPKVHLLKVNAGNRLYRIPATPTSTGNGTTPGTNQPPVAVADSYSTPLNTTLTVNAANGVLKNDTDPENQTLTASVVTPPAQGTLTLNADGSFTYVPASGFTGNVTFTYRASDGTNQSQPATVTIAVGGNQPPTAVSDSFTATEDTPLTVSAANGVLKNDTDPENQPLTAVLVSPPAQGTLTLNADGSFTYTPPANFFGTATFTYKASDGTNQSQTATATITVAPINDAPVAQNDNYSTTRGTPLTVAAPGVLLNDSDVDSTTLTVSLVSSVTNGTLTLNPNGSFTYTPNSGFTGTDTFVYRVSDGTLTDDGVVTITVNPPTNQPPVAANDSYSTDEDTPLTVPSATGVLANDSDPNTDALSAVLVTGPQHGTLTLSANGSFTYTPSANFRGTDTFTYKASDGTLESSPATVTITVAPVNDAPAGVADSYQASPDSPLNVGPAAGVLANDTDADGDPLTAILADSPQHGTLTLNSDGSFSYTPQAGFRGTDTFTYRAFDGNAQSTPTTVTIAVSHPPAAVSDTYETNEDAALVVNVGAGVLGNDSDADGDPLTAILITPPQHGTLTLSADGSFTYTPAANFHGTDSFRYQASDGVSSSSPATVTITVHPVNDPPQAAADQYSTPANTPLVVPAASGVLANDSDIDGDTLTAVLNSAAAHGVVVLQSDGSFTYTPQAGFRGVDSFVYQAGDGTVESSPVTVTILVNTPPVAVNDEFTATQDTPLVVPPATGVLANDSDADGDPLTAAVVTQPQHGTLTLNADGSFTYTPQAGFFGTDGFSYRVNDGLAQSAAAAVTINVQRLNRSPQAAADTYTTQEDTSLIVNAAAGVLANDSDADGDPLTAVVVTQPQHGTLTLSADGSFTYTPAANFHGTDTFTYKASDGTLESSPATVTITVSSVNDTPQGQADRFVTPVDTPLVVPAATGVLANDSDADGDPLTAAVVAQPQHGTLTLSADGSFTYTPNAAFHGTDTFTYQASDGTAASSPVTVTIKVNSTPVAADDSFTTSEDVPLTIADPGVLANDSDADGDVLTTTIVSQPQFGVVTLNASGGFVYTPHPNFHGIDRFTYRATDGDASSATATVTITVTSVNDSPEALFDSYAVARGNTLTVPAVDGVLANDSDADGDSLAATLVSDVQHGTLTLNLDGSFTYVPDAGFVGLDQFTYRASDGTSTSGETIVSIQVNAPPQVQNDTYTTPEDTPLVVDLNSGVLINDSDPESDPFRAELVSLPQHGTLTLQADGSFTYTPGPNFHGTDQFTYVASDDTGVSDIATVTITVSLVNDSPQAASDSYSIVQDGTLNVPAGQGVLANDTDADGDSLTATLVSGPQHGALTLSSNGSFVYIPDAGFTGTDTFLYEASDGTDTAQALVTITVTPSGGEGEGEAPPPASAVDAALSDLSDSSTSWEEAVDQFMADLGG